jgi:hypothetical protein
MNIQWFIYGLLFLVLSCEQRSAQEMPHNRKAIKGAAAPIEEDKYEIRWGSIKMPLIKYANPEVYKGKASISLTNYWFELGRPISLLKNGVPQEIELVALHRSPVNRSNFLWLNYPEHQDGQLNAEDINRLRNGLNAGDALSIRIFSKTDEVIVQSATVQIEDPAAPYHPEVDVHYPYQIEGPFGFQVIQEPGRRPVLRLDTSNEATKDIYQLYSDNLLYKIIHIPGFKTYRRLLTGEEQLFQTKDIRKSTVLGKEIVDWTSLPEFTDFQYGATQMTWGNLLAKPSSPNYDLTTFRENFNKKPVLKTGSNTLSIKSLQLIINSEEHYPVMFVTDDLSYPVLQKALHQLRTSSTVYFSQIIVEGKDSHCYLFPQSFAFHCGE